MHRLRALLQKHLFTAFIVVLLTAVFLYMRQTTAGLRYPFDPDLYRDIAQGNSVRAGNIFGDVDYAGEVNFYNPLLSWILAALSWVSGKSVSSIATHGGLILNLLGPVVFTILVRRWFGRLAAGFALLALLFIVCANYPSWAIATYSPWLFHVSFAQGLFYLALLAMPNALRGARRRDPVILGALMGIVALAHSAPALIIVAVYLIAVLSHQRTEALPWPVAARLVATTGAAAMTVASPLIVPLAWAYHLQVQNRAPGSWNWLEIGPDSIGHFALNFFGRWQLAVAAIGLIIWWRRDRRQVPVDHRTITAAWTGVAFGLLALGTYAVTTLPLASRVPSIVPSYHYLFYFSAAVCVWFGVGCAALVRSMGIVGSASRSAAPIPIAAAVLAAVLLSASLPTWRARDDFGTARATSIQLAARNADFAVSAWISDNTPSNDVILYDRSASDLSTFSPLTVGYMEAGYLDQRPTVVQHKIFANPFVDWDRRSTDSDLMLAALGHCRLDKYGAIARQYGVQHVVTTTGGPLVARTTGCAGVRVVYRDSFASVLRIEPPKQPKSQGSRLSG
jgi:MFS family permease